MTFDSHAFRDVLGRFATGVTVVTGRRADGRPIGVTVSAFSSVSLDPPLLLICLDRTTASLECYVKVRHFAVNILAEDQKELAVTFADTREDKFARVDFETWGSGCPILTGCLANLECTTQAVHEGGDHVIVVGRVGRIACSRGGRPLVHFRGAYAATGGER